MKENMQLLCCKKTPLFGSMLVVTQILSSNNYQSKPVKCAGKPSNALVSHALHNEIQRVRYQSCLDILTRTPINPCRNKLSGHINA